MNPTNDFDYSSYLYTDVLKQLVKDYLKNLTVNIPDPKNDTAHQKAIQIIDDVEAFLVSYSLSSNFFMVLQPNSTRALWTTLRDDRMINVFSFITHLTIRMKLIYGERWNNVVEDTANAFDLMYNYQKKPAWTNAQDCEIDQDLLVSLPTRENIIELFNRNGWLVVIALITLMGSYK